MRYTHRKNNTVLIARRLENKYPTNELIDVLASRLAEYEDTGMTPAEITKMQTSVTKTTLVPGDHVWINGLLGICVCEEHVVTNVSLYCSRTKKNLWYNAEKVSCNGKARCSFEESDIGKYVFLSLNDAQKHAQEAENEQKYL